jgi:S1-C subfamily serine protease
MRENRFFIRSGDLNGLISSRVAGRPVLLNYGEVIDRLERQVGAAGASLFAEPVLPRGSSGDGGTVSWYTSYPGAIIEIQEIDEIARRPIVEKLTSRLAALAPALTDPDIGAQVSNWLNTSGPGDFLSVGGEPVIVNWGLLPNTVNTREQRAEHFAKTIGRFAPSLPAPPAGAAPPTREAAAEPRKPQPALPAEPRVVVPIAAAAPPGRDGAPSHLTSVGPPARSWMAPLIASVLAAAVLLIFALPGVLVYPAASANNDVADRFEADRLKASNDSLELQLKALDDALGDKVCRPANFSLPVPGLNLDPGGDASSTPPQLRVVPTPPAQAVLPPSPTRGRDGPATVGALLEQTTVLIVAIGETHGDEFSYSQGTGFMIDERHIVTNHHVVEHLQGDRLFVANKNLGGLLQAKIVALSEPPPVETDIRVDLAVLEIEPINGATGLTLGPTPPKLATAYVAGFPGFLTEKDVKFQSFLRTLAHGVFDRANADRVLSEQNIEVPGIDLEAGRVNNRMNSGSGALPILLHDMQLAKGNSGGPLVDACGRLIGVNTLLFPSDAGARQGNVAQDVATLRKFLEEKHISFRSDDTACAPDIAEPPRPQASASPTPTPIPSAARP